MDARLRKQTSLPKRSKSKRVGRPIRETTSQIRNLQGIGLEQLKRDFLGKHRIAGGKLAPWHEAQVHAVSAVIGDVDVHRLAKIDAVPRARVTANHFEIVE
jgi:hypothetical protein